MSERLLTNIEQRTKRREKDPEELLNSIPIILKSNVVDLETVTAVEEHWKTEALLSILPIVEEYPEPTMANPEVEPEPVQVVCIYDRVQEELCRHAEHCTGEGQEICLGPAGNFDLTRSGECDVLIHDGQVYLFIKCPGEPHEAASRALGLDIMMALQSSLGLEIRKVLRDLGSTDWIVCNQLGCHSWQKKQPDGQLVLASQYMGDQKYPVALWEVASQHESLYRLLIEAALWLNSATDVMYVIVIKIQ